MNTPLAIACGYMIAMIQRGDLALMDIESRITAAKQEIPGLETQGEEHFTHLAVGITNAFVTANPDFDLGRIYAILEELKSLAYQGKLTPSVIAVLCGKAERLFSESQLRGERALTF